MGISFRSGGYERFVRFGGRTIKDGEAAAIWNMRGEHRQIIGPRRVWLYYSTVRFLTRHKAESHQFIKVHHRDGRVEFIYGPASLYENPALHDRVSVQNGVRLESANECIIVYREKQTGPSSAVDTAPHETSKDPAPHLAVEGAVEAETAKGLIPRVRVVRGPTLFLPIEGEVIHQFSWSGSSNDGVSLTPAKNIFQVLHSGSNRQWKLRLPVTTSDSVQFTASLVLDYHLASLDECVASEDPIQKMFAGIMADAQAFGNVVTSEQLRSGQQHTLASRLTRLETFPFLCDAAKAAGFVVDSVSLTDLIYSQAFQRQADKEQQMSAKLLAELADKTKRRELRELELEDRRRKIEQEAELKRKEEEVNARLEEESHARKEAAAERRIALARKENEEQRRSLEERDAAAMRFLKALKEEGVDMTKFMCTAGGMQIAAGTLSQAPVLNPPDRGDQHQEKKSLESQSHKVQVQPVAGEFADFGRPVWSK